VARHLKRVSHGETTMTATGRLVPQEQAGTSRTFVLIHGGWHGAWCWRRVIDLLEAMGHKVFAPTLTGLCERSHLLSDSVDLTTHIMDVVNLVNGRISKTLFCAVIPTAAM
jgi:hypothetical protein